MGGPAQEQHARRDGLDHIPHEAMTQGWLEGRRKHPLGTARKNSRPCVVMLSPKLTLSEASLFR